MAWTELDASGNYFVCFRIGDKRFKRSLKTDSVSEANRLVARLEENLGYIERGRMAIPADADLVTFLLSDGKVNGQVTAPEQVTLRGIFTRYFAAIPDGGLEQSTIDGMTIHQHHLERHLGHTFPIRTLTADVLQEYVKKRSK